MPLWMFYKAARMDGFDHFLLSQMGAYLQDHDRGAFELGGPTDHVFEVTGRPPESFETITRRYAAQPQAQRTTGNFLKAFAGFMSVPMRPGFNPDKFRTDAMDADAGAAGAQRGLGALASGAWRRAENDRALCSRKERSGARPHAGRRLTARTPATSDQRRPPCSPPCRLLPCSCPMSP